MTKTYVDANVLIWAARGNHELSDAALKILSQNHRYFVGSTFLQLEVEPKSAYHGRDLESQFYEEFFDSCSEWVQMSEDLAQKALEEARQQGLGAVDAVHVMVASQADVDEFITAEKPSRPLLRSTLVPITTIFH